MNYHLLPPVNWGITQQEVARILVEFSRVHQLGNERSDGPASSQDPHGLPHRVSTQPLEGSGL